MIIFDIIAYGVSGNDMITLFIGLLVGYCYDLDHMLISDIRVTILSEIPWG